MSTLPLVVQIGSRSERAWYAIYTRHQHEKTVADILSRKSFEVFLPVYSTVHRWKDRQRQLFLPLYPSYVFLRDRLERKLEILITPGVHFIVGAGDGPQPIPDFEIDAVKRVIESSLAVEPHPFLQCGEWVRVIDGPLEGIEGILVRKKNSLRLVLSVEMLMKSVAVEVDASLVERTVARHPGLLDRVSERMRVTAC
jgi:transcription antitermination factor NusG